MASRTLPQGRVPTLKPILPFLQQMQASMRKTKVKRPEKEMATTARDEDQVSSLSGAPSAGHIKRDKSCENVAEDGGSSKQPEVSAGSHSDPL